MPGTVRYRHLGLCLSCGKQPEPGRKRCRICLDKSQKRNECRRIKLKAQGHCVLCGKPNDRLPKVACSACETDRVSREFSLKMKVFSTYGGAFCACCGEATIEFLTVDHVNDDGAAHRRQIAAQKDDYHRNSKRRKDSNRCNQHILYWLRSHNYPPGFQVLCMNCNFAKGQFGECPHQRDKAT